MHNFILEDGYIHVLWNNVLAYGIAGCAIYLAHPANVDLFNELMSAGQKKKKKFDK